MNNVGSSMKEKTAMIAHGRVFIALVVNVTFELCTARNKSADNMDGEGGTVAASKVRSKDGEEESAMKELKRKVEAVVKASSWWQRRGLDCAILAGAFAVCLPAGKSSSRPAETPMKE